MKNEDEERVEKEIKDLMDTPWMKHLSACYKMKEKLEKEKEEKNE